MEDVVRTWIAIGIVGLIGAGCDQAKVQSTVGPSPTAQAPAPVVHVALIPPPTTEPVEAADNAPPSCVMMINQQPVEFPQALLRFKKSGDQVTALLYSDDPKDALENIYSGNGFYFQLALDVPAVQFNRATWSHSSESSERVDTPFGIFLDGHRRQLQPLDVRIRILHAISGGFKVQMAGTFLSVDPQDSLAPTQVVNVTAWLLAQTR
jgi:hypothetical protein